jgi:hypothetical protein
VVAERRDPRHSFAGHQMSTPWDELQRAYCNGEALWTYPTTLFLLALEGVVVEEMSPGAGATNVARAARTFWDQSKRTV